MKRQKKQKKHKMNEVERVLQDHLGFYFAQKYGSLQVDCYAPGEFNVETDIPGQWKLTIAPRCNIRQVRKGYLSVGFDLWVLDNNAHDARRNFKDKPGVEERIARWAFSVYERWVKAIGLDRIVDDILQEATRLRLRADEMYERLTRVRLLRGVGRDGT